MKIKLNYFEVEVKAKTEGAPKMNEDDTMYFMNWLSLAFDYAAAFEQGNGYHASADAYRKASNAIDDITLEYFRNKRDGK